MSRQERKQTFTIVAFRYDKKNSVLYENLSIPEDVALRVKRALERLDADVISIRRVYEKNPTEEE